MSRRVPLDAHQAERRAFIYSLGRQRIMTRLGFASQQAVTHAIKRGIPARWLPVIQEMCREDGRECPARMFNTYRAGLD